MAVGWGPLQPFIVGYAGRPFPEVHGLNGRAEQSIVGRLGENLVLESWCVDGRSDSGGGETERLYETLGWVRLLVCATSD